MPKGTHPPCLIVEMQTSPTQKTPVNRSTPIKSPRVKPALSIACSPPSPLASNTDVAPEKRNPGFVSPALIPIPSPKDRGNRESGSQSPVIAFPWIDTSDGNGDGIRSPLAWNEETKSNIPMAPRIGGSKERFSPLPLTPIGQAREELSFFGRLQLEFLAKHPPADGVYQLPEEALGEPYVVIKTTGGPIGFLDPACYPDRE